MTDEVPETYYRVTPECPCSDRELKGQAETIDRFLDRYGDIHHIIDCNCCETRLELVIHHDNPMDVEIWVTPADQDFG